MATVTDPRPFWEFDCAGCHSDVVAGVADVRYAWFGANYGGDRPEKRYFVPCPSCGHDNMLPYAKVTDLVVSTATAWKSPVAPLEPPDGTAGLASARAGVQGFVDALVSSGASPDRYVIESRPGGTLRLTDVLVLLAATRGSDG